MYWFYVGEIYRSGQWIFLFLGIILAVLVWLDTVDREDDPFEATIFATITLVVLSVFVGMTWPLSVPLVATVYCRKSRRIQMA